MIKNYQSVQVLIWQKKDFFFLLPWSCNKNNKLYGGSQEYSAAEYYKRAFRY